MFSTSSASSEEQHRTEDTVKDVLLDLADDVTRGIVVEWLEFVDVVLDSAYNNRELSRVFRGLLSWPLTPFDFSRFQK
jgi:hypothetical protein